MPKRKKRRPKEEQQRPPEAQPAAPLRVVFYKEDDGTTPLLAWLDGLKPAGAVVKCRVGIELLRAQGNQLRRPFADSLRDGIHELRTMLGRVRFRLLSFFHERMIVLTHGFTKQQAQVPDEETDRASAFRARFRADPDGHTHTEGE
jgi:hypothetical protein